eukprot:XP_014039032.1 PREDICTED: uncharacterized protein LOC106592237 isoform X1 [Salmo salar]
MGRNPCVAEHTGSGWRCQGGGSYRSTCSQPDHCGAAALTRTPALEMLSHLCVDKQEKKQLTVLEWNSFLKSSISKLRLYKKTPPQLKENLVCQGWRRGLMKTMKCLPRLTWSWEVWLLLLLFNPHTTTTCSAIE